MFPLAFLPENHALAVAIMSYNGRLEYGLLGDYDALPDIDVIADGIDVARYRSCSRPPRDARSSSATNGGGQARERWRASRANGRTDADFPRRRRAHAATGGRWGGADRPGPRRPVGGLMRALPVIACKSVTAVSRTMDNLIGPDETAYRLDLTAAQLKIVHTALKSLQDDLGHEEPDVRHVVVTVLAKLPGEHEIRAIDLARELRGRPPSPPLAAALRSRARTWRRRSSAPASTAARTHRRLTASTPSSSDDELLDLLGDLGPDRAAGRWSACT